MIPFQYPPSYLQPIDVFIYDYASIPSTHKSILRPDQSQPPIEERGLSVSLSWILKSQRETYFGNPTSFKMLLV